jgi:hypothetical protein
MTYFGQLVAPYSKVEMLSNPLHTRFAIPEINEKAMR